MNDNERMRRFKRMAENMAAMIDWPFEDQMVIDAIDRAVALRESGPDGGRRRQGPTLP